VEYVQQNPRETPHTYSLRKSTEEFNAFIPQGRLPPPVDPPPAETFRALFSYVFGGQT
jgi:hypothetical protein